MSTTVPIPVYLPEHNGVERVVIGEATIEEDGIVLIDFRDTLAGPLAVELLTVAAVKSLTFECYGTIEIQRSDEKPNRCAHCVKMDKHRGPCGKAWTPKSYKEGTHA